MATTLGTIATLDTADSTSHYGRIDTDGDIRYYSGGLEVGSQESWTSVSTTAYYQMLRMLKVVEDNIVMGREPGKVRIFAFGEVGMSQEVQMRDLQGAGTTTIPWQDAGITWINPTTGGSTAITNTPDGPAKYVITTSGGTTNNV